jgi:hypothetical protein
MANTPLHNDVFTALAQASNMVAALETRVGQSLSKLDKSFEKYDARFDKYDERIGKAERWQSWMMGIGVTVSLLMAVLVAACAGIVVEEVKAIPAQIRMVVNSGTNSSVH